MWRYIGGKGKLAPWVISNFPQNYVGMKYVELFAGAGWTWYHKNWFGPEVLNDVNTNVCRTWWALKDKKTRRYLIKKLSQTPYSRSLFDDLRNYDANDHPFRHQENAFIYLYLQQTCFAGKGPAAGFGVPKGGRTPLIALSDRLDGLSTERLHNLKVTNMDFEGCIAAHDSPTTLFYADPPYIGAERYYGASFDARDHIRLANLLAKTKGQVVLSYYPDPTLDSLYPKKLWRRVTCEVGLHSAGATKERRDLETRPRRTEMLLIRR